MPEWIARIKDLGDPARVHLLLPGRIGAILAIAIRSRMAGLAAEVAFWGVFILPWALLSVVSSVAFVGREVGVDAVVELRNQILDRADQVLTPAAVDSILKPTVDEVLLKGNGGLGVIGFIVALWSGSRLISALVVSVRKVHEAAAPGVSAVESWMRIRAKSIGAYSLALLTIALGIPLLLIGPALLDRFGWGAASAILYWGLAVALGLVLLAGLYRASVPQNDSRAALTGAVVGLIVWGLGSLWLRLYLVGLRSANPIEAFAAPVALMLWAYVTAIAVLLGAAVDAGLRRDLSGQDVVGRAVDGKAETPR